MYTRVNPHSLREEIIDTRAYESELQDMETKCSVKWGEDLKSCSKLGELFRLDGRYEKAVEVLQAVLESIKDQSDDELEFQTELRLAITYQYMGDFEHSLNLFEKLEFEPIQALESYVYQHRGILEFEMGNFWMAIHYFERAMRLRLDNPELLTSTEIAIQRVKKELKLK